MVNRLQCVLAAMLMLVLTVGGCPPTAADGNDDDTARTETGDGSAPPAADGVDDDEDTSDGATVDPNTANTGSGGNTPMQSNYDQRLIGNWWYEENYWDTINNFSTTSVTLMQLSANGQILIKTKTFASGEEISFGGDWNEVRGTWQAAGDTVVITYTDGSQDKTTYYIEDQSDGRYMLTETGNSRQLWTFQG